LHIYDQQVSLCNARTKVGKSLVQKEPFLSLERADKGNSFQIRAENKMLQQSRRKYFHRFPRVMKRRVFSMAAGGAQSAFILTHSQ
jgi:hypothetical protein